MPFLFPDAPAIGDTANGYKWDGEKWIVIGSDDPSGSFLPLSGGTLTGPLTLAGPPTVDLHAATKQYADSRQSGYPSRTAAMTATIPAATTFVELAGYAAAGDGGAALYKKVGSEPLHAGKFQSADGAWWEIADVAPNVRCFGAVFDNVTDDLAAWNAAIGWANAKGGEVSLTATGAVSYVSGSITPILGNEIWIHGDHAAGVRHGVATTALFTFGDNTYQPDGGGIVGLDFHFTGTPDATQIAIRVHWGARLTFDQIFTYNLAQFVSVGVDDAHRCSQILISNIFGYCADVGAPYIDLRNTNGTIITRCHVFADAAGVGAVAGRSFVRISISHLDSCQIDNCFAELFWAGLLVSAGGTNVVQNIVVENVFFDGMSGYGIFLETTTATAKVTLVRVSNVWIAGAQTCSRHVFLTNQGVPANGTIEDVSIENTTMIVAQNNNIYVSANVRRLSLVNVRAYAPNGANNSSPSVYIENGALDTQIIGGHYNTDIAHYGYAQRAPWAISIAAETDRYVMRDFEASGTTASLLIGANATASARRVISGNNPDYAGYQTGGIYVLPATGTPVFNTTPFNWEIHVFGGTINGIGKNGALIANATSQILIPLSPGDAFTLSYSAAPSIAYFIKR